MSCRAFRTPKAIAAALAALILPGCITIQAIEPVIEAPVAFRGDTTVAVEFAQPGTIGFRCAERGAKFLGLPGINSGACSDTQLITMIDPCATITAGDYARALCNGLSAHREEAELGARAPAKEIRRAAVVLASFSTGQPGKKIAPSSKISEWPSVLVEFAKPDLVELRCAERGAKMFQAAEKIVTCSDRLLVTTTNPCEVEYSGWYARTLCHELGHANGWSADHPNRGPLASLKLASQSPQAIALANRGLTAAVVEDATVAYSVPQTWLANAIIVGPEPTVADDRAAIETATEFAAPPHTADSVANAARAWMARFDPVAVLREMYWKRNLEQQLSMLDLGAGESSWRPAFDIDTHLMNMLATEAFVEDQAATETPMRCLSHTSCPNFSTFALVRVENLTVSTSLDTDILDYLRPTR